MPWAEGSTPLRSLHSFCPFFYRLGGYVRVWGGGGKVFNKDVPLRAEHPASNSQHFDHLYTSTLISTHWKKKRL